MDSSNREQSLPPGSCGFGRTQNLVGKGLQNKPNEISPFLPSNHPSIHRSITYTERQRVELEGQTKNIQLILPALLQDAANAVDRNWVLKGTSVEKDQNASFSFPASLLSPWLESQPACIQTHLQLCPGRRESLYHLGQASGAFKFIL